MVKNKKALFFDRDGTLIKSQISVNKKPIGIKKLKDCKIFPSAKKILDKLKLKWKQSGYKLSKDDLLRQIGKRSMQK